LLVRGGISWAFSKVRKFGNVQKRRSFEVPLSSLAAFASGFVALGAAGRDPVLVPEGEPSGLADAPAAADVCGEVSSRAGWAAKPRFASRRYRTAVTHTRRFGTTLQDKIRKSTQAD